MCPNLDSGCLCHSRLLGTKSMRENKFIQYYTDLIHLLNLFLCFLLCWIREYLQAELMWVKLHPRHHVDESKTSRREITDDSETARRIPFSEVAVSILCIQSHESLIPQNLISSSQSFYL